MFDEMGAECVHATGLVGAEVAGKLRCLTTLVLPVLVQTGAVRVTAATVFTGVCLLGPFLTCTHTLVLAILKFFNGLWNFLCNIMLLAE